jgi:hypothetical protein
MKTLRGEVTGRGIQSLLRQSPDDHPRLPEVFPRLSFTPEEAALVTGFSRTRIFGAIRDDELTARKSGKATVIETAELTRWLRSLPTRGRPPQAADSNERDKPSFACRNEGASRDRTRQAF